MTSAGTDLADELAAARKSAEPPLLVAACGVFDLRTAQQIRNLVLTSDLRLIHRNGCRFG